MIGGASSDEWRRIINEYGYLSLWDREFSSVRQMILTETEAFIKGSIDHID